MAKVRGGNPILFPFCGRTFDHGEIHFWRDDNGVRRPMPIHGLARQGDFQVTRLDERGFTALFQPGEEARAAYPYDYEFTVSYRFEPLALFVELTPAQPRHQTHSLVCRPSFLFHPAVERGPHPGGLLHPHPCRRDAAAEFRATASSTPVPASGPEESLANKDLLDVFHTALKNNAVVFGERGGEDHITVRIGPDRVPPESAVVVTWTQADDSPFLLRGAVDGARQCTGAQDRPLPCRAERNPDVPR